MKVAIPQETFPGERRVALIPADVPRLTKAGLEVCVQSGAGEAAGFSDDEYRERGAEIATERAAVFSADVVAQVRALGANPEQGVTDLALLREGQVLIGTCDPLGNPGAVDQLCQHGVTLFALELIPRITRAQSMDVLSSMATIAGYRAVLLAAVELPRIFPLLTTAAGTLSPARVLVIGVGVAGLQAIATARRLGAVVQAYDVRPACREQVESVGGKFVELDLETGQSEDQGGYAKALGEEFYRRQREAMAKVVAESDVVITTAAIPGKTAPLLVTTAAVEAMRPGSVIVDLAAERGGNCEVSQPDQVVTHHGVRVLGPTNLVTDVPTHASQMFSRNLVTFLTHLVKDGELDALRDDEIIRGTLTACQRKVTHPRLRELLGLPPEETAPESAAVADAADDAAADAAADAADTSENTDQSGTA